MHLPIHLWSNKLTKLGLTRRKNCVKRGRRKTRRLAFEPLDTTVAIHHSCSNMKMALEHKLLAVAQACARNVVVPDRVGCCGFAGDRGFTHPELNQAALQELKPAVSKNCTAGYSTSRTCEIGLSRHSGLYYKSIVYLVDKSTQVI